MEGWFQAFPHVWREAKRERNWAEGMAPAEPMFLDGRMMIFWAEIKSSAMYEAEVGID